MPSKGSQPHAAGAARLSKPARFLRAHSRLSAAQELKSFFSDSLIPNFHHQLLEAYVRAIAQEYESEPEKDNDEVVLHQAREMRSKVFLTAGLFSDVLHPKRSVPRRFTFPLPSKRATVLEKADFKLPYAIYSSLPKAHSNWKNLKKNVWIDIEPAAPEEPPPKCTCTTYCDEDCLNRILQCECDQHNCPFGKLNCGNRAFQTLTKELQRGKLYDNGFEVVWLGLRGYGLKTTRPYAPGELIIEYCGDVISPIEMQRRIETHYSKSKNHYFLSLENGCVIDSGLRGSAARFANHSCNPNSEMQKWYVHGIPRIGLFASESIPTGTELTYDYNFDWFDGAKMQACLCGAPNCRGYIGKRSSRRPTPDELPLQDYRQLFSIPKQRRKKKKKATKRAREEPLIPAPRSESGKKSAKPDSNRVAEISNSPKPDTRNFKSDGSKSAKEVSKDKIVSENEYKRITRSSCRKLSDSFTIPDESEDTSNAVSSRILRRQSGAPSAKRRKVSTVSKPAPPAVVKTAEPTKGLPSKAADSQQKGITKDPEPLLNIQANTDPDTTNEPATETPKTVRHYSLIAKAPAQPPIVAATRAPPAHFPARPKNIAPKPLLLSKPQHTVIAPKLVKKPGEAKSIQASSDANRKEEAKSIQASDANRKEEAKSIQASSDANRKEEAKSIQALDANRKEEAKSTQASSDASRKEEAIVNQKLQNGSARRNSFNVAKEVTPTVSQDPQEDTQPSVSHLNLGQVQPGSCQSRKPSVSNILNPESSSVQTIEPNLVKPQSRQHNLPSNSPPTDRAIHFGSPLSADSYSSGYSEPRPFQQHSPNVFRPQQLERRKSLVFDVTDPNKYHLSRKLSTYDTSWRRDFQHDPQSNQYNSKPVEKVARNIELPVPPLLSRLQQNQVEPDRQLGRQEEYLQPAHPQTAQPFATVQGNMKPQEFSSLPTINKQTFNVPSQNAGLFSVFDSSPQPYRSISRNHTLDHRPFETQSLHLPRASRQQMSSYEPAKPFGTQPDQAAQSDVSQQPKSRVSISSLTSHEEHDPVADPASKPGMSTAATLTDLRKARRGRPALASKTVMVNTKTSTPSVGVKPKRGRPKAGSAPGKQLPIPKIPDMVTACEPGKKVIEESNMRARGDLLEMHLDTNSDDERTKHDTSSGQHSSPDSSETGLEARKGLQPRLTGVKPRRGRPPNSGPAQRLTLAPLASRPPTIKSNDGSASTTKLGSKPNDGLASTTKLGSKPNDGLASTTKLGSKPNDGLASTTKLGPKPNDGLASTTKLGPKPPTIVQRISSQPAPAQGIRKDGAPTASTRSNTRPEFVPPPPPPPFTAKPQASCKSAFVTSVLNTPSPPTLSPIKPGLDIPKRTTMQAAVPSPKTVAPKPSKRSPPGLGQNEPVVPRKRGRPRSKGSSLSAGPRAFANIAPNIAPNITPNIAPNITPNIVSNIATNWARPLAPLRRNQTVPDQFGRLVLGSPTKPDHEEEKGLLTRKHTDATAERNGPSKGKQAK